MIVKNHGRPFTFIHFMIYYNLIDGGLDVGILVFLLIFNRIYKLQHETIQKKTILKKSFFCMIK